MYQLIAINECILNYFSSIIKIFIKLGNIKTDFSKRKAGYTHSVSFDKRFVNDLFQIKHTN